jgi:hypothetical protein
MFNGVLVVQLPLMLAPARSKTALDANITTGERA